MNGFPRHPAHPYGPLAADPCAPLWFEDESHANWERLRRIWLNDGGTEEGFLLNLPEPPEDHPDAQVVPGMAPA